ncbi:MAG: cbb3-type cytochrome oxidase assembly protein [Armatimonadetes bacterium]|nr:cbb3-type cytochrome oxidase assembly protein [Armatimonadota bacterium]
MSIPHWLPIATVAALFFIAGVVFAIVSTVAGQYRDPEAAKHTVLDDDTHPRGRTGSGAGPS